MKKYLIVTLAALMSIGNIGLSIAEDTSTTATPQKDNGACKDDVAKFCKDVQAGEGRIAKCLKEHDSELSSACKTSMTERKEEMKEFKEACAADKDKFCKDVQVGEGRVIKCLKEHEAELAAACKTAVNEVKETKTTTSTSTSTSTTTTK